MHRFDKIKENKFTANKLKKPDLIKVEIKSSDVEFNKMLAFW